MRSGFREQLRAMRDAAYAAIGGFHAACRTAAQAHSERTAQLVGFDEQLRTLGPGGIAAVLTEVTALREKVSAAEAAVAAARAEAAAAEAVAAQASEAAEAKGREMEVGHGGRRMGR